MTVRGKNHPPLSASLTSPPQGAGLSHMEADEHNKLLLPLGRRWPEGSDEEVIYLNSWIFVVLAGTPSSTWRHLLPAGEKGDSGDLRSYAIPLPCRRDVPQGQRGVFSQALTFMDAIHVH
ncbi:hypothetical protein CKA34_22655 (plasmid) [Rhizobium sp. 11515TR]|nr:hypothetical protein CKA34_22655 [Rhizobium sp. 11515TR]